MCVFADGVPDYARTAAGTPHTRTQADENGDCQRETGQQNPRSDRAVQVHPFERLDGKNHQTAEHAQDEDHADGGLMPGPLQKTPASHELSIRQNASGAIRHANA